MKYLTAVCMLVFVGVVLIQASLAGPTAGRASRWSGIEGEISKISPALQAVLTKTAQSSFFVYLSEQADLRHVGGLTTKESKGRAVYDALRTVAMRAQAPLRAELDAQGVDYRAFFVVNMLMVRGDMELAQTLAMRSDVARLEANPAVQIALPQIVAEPAQETSIAWGVERIRADEVWAFGYTGQGIVVAGQDTGYYWEHLALKRQYRGWDGVAADHNYNWHDAIHTGGGYCGADVLAPCDGHGHGTHTMGTMVGKDGDTYEIGVAPGSQWIGCRNMNDIGVGTPATYTECFEFFLAPYPLGGDPMTEGDPNLAPHVINNSWTCPPSEGCDVDALRSVVENVRAAGIVVVVSAGNSGASGCETIDTPPARHEAAFSVGATSSLDTIASFSSRGPVVEDDTSWLKPNVVAPGVSVWSSLRSGSYGTMSGTSMAAPHVAGLVALVWSAVPSLIGDVDGTEWLIQRTARPAIDGTCGGDTDGHPNNVYGWGIVDALNAIVPRRFFLTLVMQGAP